MQSANLSGPLKGLRPYQALIGPTQASGLAGGFDCSVLQHLRHEIPHLFGGFFLHPTIGVGVGAQGEPGVIVA